MAEIEQTNSEDTQDQVEEFVAVAAEPEDDAAVTVDADADDEELVESEDSLTYSSCAGHERQPHALCAGAVWRRESHQGRERRGHRRQSRCCEHLCDH